MNSQKYIRIILSFILILSNLSVAFSMHFCQGMIEEVKLNHIDNNACKIEIQTACCPPKAEENSHCEFPEENSKDQDDCCSDVAYSDDIQKQQTVKVLKITPVIFVVTSLETKLDEFLEIRNSFVQTYLDSYVESNAPPIYILHRQLVLYEA